jgi:hypothetical protein
MNAYRMNVVAGRFMAGTAVFGSTSTSMIVVPEKGVLQRGYDALNHLWTLMKAGWVNPGVATSQPTSASLIEFAYAERMRTIMAHPSLADVFTMEVAARAAYLVMASQKLNDRTSSRLARLAKSVDNWDGEGAKAMDLSSLANFVGFLEKSKSAPTDMNLFLGFYGEIVTSWELGDGSTLDMSFNDRHIELATDEHDEVFAIGDARLYSLIAEL